MNLTDMPGVHLSLGMGGGQMMQVYLIDDDPVWRQLVARLLGPLGFQVVGQAADGASALEALSELEPDLIVTDCQMPLMDGITFARELRARGDRTPVIMLSGLESEDVVAGAIDAGVNCFLAKPLDARLLHDAVRMVVAPVA